MEPNFGKAVLDINELILPDRSKNQAVYVDILSKNKCTVRSSELGKKTPNPKADGAGREEEERPATRAAKSASCLGAKLADEPSVCKISKFLNSNRAGRDDSARVHPKSLR